MIFAIDFDGTIVEHDYPGVGQLLPGAIEWLRAFQEHGVKLILFTMRSEEKLQQAIRLLNSHGLEFWAYNENPDQDWTNSPKVHADVYVDDRALGCPTMLDSKGRPCVDWAMVGPMLYDYMLQREGSARIVPNESGV